MSAVSVLASIAVIVAGCLITAGLTTRRHSKLSGLVEMLERDSNDTTSSRGIGRLEKIIRKTGWNLTAQQLGILLIGASVAIMLFASVTIHSIVIAVLIAVVLPVAAVHWMAGYTAERRQRNIERQLVPALTTMLGMLTAGRQIDEALDRASARAKSPLKGELELIVKIYRTGIPIDEAILRAADRLGNTEFRFFAIAVRLQAQKGGDITTLIAKVIAEVVGRIELKATRKAKIAEAKMAKKLVAGFPAFILVFFFLAEPAQIMALTHGVGILMAIAAAILWVLGVGVAGALVNRVERAL